MSRWNSRRIPKWDQLVCPQCQNDLDMQQDDLDEGEVVVCTNCGSEFEVMTRPFELRRIEDFSPGPGVHRPAA
jgi:alpha-aminoadipate/glutamate carrier protein LysW